MSGKKPVGRPPADEVSTDAAKMAKDANAIAEDEPGSIVERANALLENSAKTTLLQAANKSAKKALIIASQELEEATGEDIKKTSAVPSFKGGFSVADIKTIAETLPEAQREPFIRQALGLPGPNPVMNALLQQKQHSPIAPDPAATNTPMSFSDAIQGMMGMMTMQITMQQSKNEEWRQQMEYAEAQHRRHMDEIRELTGGGKTTGPNPVEEIYKVQLDTLKDALKESKDMIKDLLAAPKSDTSSALNDKILELTTQNLENQKTALEQKIASLENLIKQDNRHAMDIQEVIKRVNEAGGNLRQGDSTDLQLANDHEYKMRKLEIDEQSAADEKAARLAEANARALEAQSRSDLFRSIAVEVGKVVVNSRTAPKDLTSSSGSVKSIVGAM